MTTQPAPTLAAARKWLLDQLGDGASCPCCRQFAKVYRRKISSGVARGLVQMYTEHGQGWVHVPSTGHLARLGGEFARLRYWGLVEEETALREDGGRAGWWRVTDHGRAFVLGRVRVPKYAEVYDGRCLNLDHAQKVGIRDCLGARFNYDDLMAKL